MNAELQRNVVNLKVDMLQALNVNVDEAWMPTVINFKPLSREWLHNWSYYK
ncbi:MAG: hypothetical protein U5K71_12095 [Gracilimonas sp.]|nr:hypothetical protein [Gracilimonas sp.]